MDRKTEVVILGNRFTIKSNLSDSQIRNLVQKVETMVKSCQSKSKSMSMQSASLMACLFFANELMEVQTKIDTFKEDAVLQLSKLKDVLSHEDEQREITAEL